MARARTSLRRLWRERRGGVGVFVACAMPLLAGFAAFAVDYGTIQLDARRLQGVADGAALAGAAAGDATRADAAARALVAASWARASVVRTVSGRYRADAGIAPAQRFTPDVGGDAAQVQVATDSPTFFAQVFGIRSVRIVRQATAQRRAAASFSAGSRLVGLDGGVLNALLSGLTGRTVTLGVLDHRALVESNVDLFALFDRVRVRANLSAGSYADLLAADVRVSDVFAALNETLSASGEASAAGAVSRVNGAVGAQTIKLGALIDAGPLARQAGGGTGVARVPVLPFMTTLLEAGGARQLRLDLGATVPGVASTKLMVAIGERAQSSPWLTVTDRGETVVRTAQARIYAQTRLAPTLLPGLSSLVSIDLPLFVEAASAEARLRAIECDASPAAATVEGRVGPLEAAIGTVDERRLDDFSRPIVPASARLLDTLLVDVTGSSRVSLGAAEPWQARRFTRAMIDAGQVETIRASTMTQGVAASLIAQATLRVSLLGLPIPIDPLLRGIGQVLSAVAGPIDLLLGAVTGGLGVGIGEADLRVNGLRCGSAVLVG
ncbi:pilus assembly protein TadG-related protein [Sphingomonas sp.]|uniref:pilus assembly protein TadG-related protein n=1 Tax=Sphingomonas sp. TaxID=28214 RepID=UPI0035C808B4